MIYFYFVPTQNLGLSSSTPSFSFLEEEVIMDHIFYVQLAHSCPWSVQGQDTLLMAFFAHVLTSPIFHCQLLYWLKPQRQSPYLKKYLPLIRLSHICQFLFWFQPQTSQKEKAALVPLVLTSLGIFHPCSTALRLEQFPQGQQWPQMIICKDIFFLFSKYFKFVPIYEIIKHPSCQNFPYSLYCQNTHFYFFLCSHFPAFTEWILNIP